MLHIISIEFDTTIFCLKMSRALKQEDERELSKLYEAEFNQPDLHDRVLVFDVFASWPHSVSDVDEKNETSEACGQIQSEDEGDAETIEISNEETNMNGSIHNEHKAGSQDCKSDIKDANGDQQIKIGTNLHDSKEIAEEKETADLDKQETVGNDDITHKTSNGNEMKDEQESQTATDDNGAALSLTNKEQVDDGNEIFSEGNDSFSINKVQVIRQHKFYIHSSWLAVQSSYFRSLFFSGMKESNAKEVHVQILDNEEQAHLMLLEAMYKIDVLDEANVHELLEVLKLAHKYDVKFVFRKCKYCLKTAVDSLEVCETIMRFIKVDNTITDVEDLASTLQSFLAKEFSPLDKTWQTRSFEKLCEPSVRYLISSDDLRTESENTIFHALMYWIEQQGIENVLENEGMPSILSVVRFELISIDYLYNIVQHDSIAKTFPDFNHHYLRGISYHALSSNIRETLNNKPVKRGVKPAQTSGVTLQATPNFTWSFTWVISRDKLNAIIETDKEIKSDEFWYCGYKMVLEISNVKESNVYSVNNNETFNAKLSLEILNVKQHSVVEISWDVASQANNCRSRYGQKTDTFKKGANISSIDISYEIAVKKVIPQPKSGLFSSSTGGFSFSAPATHGTASTFCPKPGFGEANEPIVQAPSCTGFSFGSPLSTKPLEKGHADADLVPKQESPNTPCLSIDVHMKLV